MHAVRPDFIVLSETHQTGVISDREIEIVNYDHYYRVRLDRGAHILF